MEPITRSPTIRSRAIRVRRLGVASLLAAAPVAAQGRGAFEFEANTGTATRPDGLADRSYRFLDARSLLVSVRVEGLSVILGAGGSRVDADISGAEQHGSLKAGLSLFRHAASRSRRVLPTGALR